MIEVTATRYTELLRKVLADPQRGRLVRESLSDGSVDPKHWPSGSRFYAVPNGGFVVVDGDLQGVFAAQAGMGDAIMRAAVGAGAVTLDHFDVGPLSALYERHGFVETRREANWTPGGPDVVYRTRY